MPTAPQRGTQLRTIQAASEVTEGVKRNYTPEHMEAPETQAMRSTLVTRRNVYEQTGSRMESPLRGVGDLAAHYEKEGWRDIEHEHGGAGPSMYAFHDLAEHGHNPFPLPTRWEDLHPDEQARAMAGLEVHGTSIGRLQADLGRGLDRAYTRSDQMGATPYAANFYEPGAFPRQRITSAMPDIPGEHAAGAIAMTSPQNKFAAVTNDGNVITSNINAAATAGQVAHEGRNMSPDQFHAHLLNMSGDQLNAIGQTHGYGGVGIHGNVKKAAWALHQGMQGTPIEEWRGLPSKTTPAGKSIFGEAPKTSPFASSFVDEAAPFHVTDVFGLDLAFPHLSGVKGSGVNINPSGADTGSKSERELALDRIPHAHAAIDFAFREALGERGLSKIRFQQGAAWGESQIHRTLLPDPGAKRLSYHPERVYGFQAETMPSTSFTKRSKRGVGSLFLPG